MKKNKKFILTSCLLFATLAISATAVACADKDPAPSEPTTSTIMPMGKQNLAYAPDIYVDWGEYSSENIPNALKGSAYKLFSARAEDVYGDELSVTTRVYLHYLEDTKNLITVTGNSVVPMCYGVYTVEYSATDVFGNVGVYTYEFACEEVTPLSLELAAGYETNTLAGTQTQLAGFTHSNGLGNVKMKITATHNDGKVVYDLTDKTSFVPMYAGEYNVEYLCSDYNSAVKCNYTLSVAKNDIPVFFSEADLPKYFIVGKEYTLPGVEAYQFATGAPASVTPVISVRKGKEKVKRLDGNTFTADEEGVLTFTYTIACGENTAKKTYTAQAVNVGETGPTFDIAKYFYPTDASVTATDKFTMISAKADGASVEFINSLSSNAFSMKLATDPNATNFEAVNLYLKDSADESVVIKLTYANPGKTDSSFAVNDGDPQKTKNAESSTQLITYDDSTKQIGFNGKISINCPKKFAGFPSGKINFSLEFVGVTGRSEVMLYGINNQVMSKDEGDFFAPEMWFTTGSQSTFGINQVVELAEVTCMDVLDPNVTLYVNVLSPTQEYAVSESGVTLQNYTGDIANCRFRTKEYGSYLIRFTAKDSSGNSKMYAYSITVKEIVPPTVVFENEMPNTVKVGEGFTVSNVIIDDDVSAPEKCTVSVTLLGPLADVTFVTPGKTYNLTMKGTYYLCYSVADEAGNTTMLKHKLIVE